MSVLFQVASSSSLLSCSSSFRRPVLVTELFPGSVMACRGAQCPGGRGIHVREDLSPCRLVLGVPRSLCVPGSPGKAVLRFGAVGLAAYFKTESRAVGFRLGADHTGWRSQAPCAIPSTSATFQLGEAPWPSANQRDKGSSICLGFLKTSAAG